MNSRSFEGVRSVFRAWESLSPSEQRRWDGSALGQSFLKAVIPRLQSEGFVRIRILERPAWHQMGALRRLITVLSEQIGFLVPQTWANNRIALIRDAGKDYTSHNTRGHQTSAELAFHSDRSDLNVLLYVRGAATGGGVSVISYARAAADLDKTDSQALQTLFEPFPFDLREERIFPEERWCMRPILWRNEHGLRGHYIRRFIADSQRHGDCPRLTVEQIRALDAFDATLQKLRRENTFLPGGGELFLLDNYRVMHARDRFEDIHKSVGRLVIRTWVAPYHSEELPGFLLPIAGSVRAGAYRGGVGKGALYHHRLGRTRRVPLSV